MSEETTIRTQSGITLTVRDLIHRGDNFEIVRATSDSGGDEPLTVRSLRVDSGWPPAVRNKIAELREPEAEAARTHFGDQASLETVEDNGSNDDINQTLVVHPYVEGTTLTRYVHAEHTDGMPLDLALELASQVASQLAKLHEQRLVHRSPSPEHILISGETATLVGYGSVCRRQQRPAPWQLGGDERYVAPEVIRERSGTFIHPRADVYTFGATLSYMLTGIHPTTTPEAPIDNEAWRRLINTPEGMRLLIAHCMQPLHKNRMVNASKLVPLLNEGSLPSRETSGFGAIALLAPWTGALEGRPSGLSAGPLTTRGAQREQASDDEEPAPVERPSENAERATQGNASHAPDDSDSANTGAIEVRGVRRSRLLVGFCLIAAFVIGGAILRLCS